MGYRTCLVLVCVVIGTVSAHVRLTYPPARQFDFDFLDNVRTEGPCGMEPGDSSTRTEIMKGSTFTVTWHLAYSHRGGFRLELINEINNETVIAVKLTGDDEFINDKDITSTSYEVSLPADFEGNATLRLIRNAAEWTAGNQSLYIFWSCSDILVSENTAADCHGGCTGDACDDGKCTSCSALSFGDFCQYKDNCAGYEDCNMNGECWKVSETTYPQHLCFCKEGYFGTKCEKENPTDFTVNIDKEKYYQRSLSNQVTLYYMIRKDEGEIEIAVEAVSSTYVAVGWKPMGMKQSCQNFPVQYRSGEPISEPEAEPESTSAPSNNRKRRSVELNPDIQTEEDDGYDSDWSCNTTDWTGPVSEPEATAEPEPEPEGTSEPEPEGTPAPLHPMDCADIVIGRAKGSLSNVADYYTRDRSTPRLDDEFYMGDQSLEAAGAKEEDGVTTVVFRRKLKTTDAADHDIAFHEAMDVIWAKGQERGQEFHNPPSGLESCEAMTIEDYLFYRKDDIRYHGTHNDQRGLISGIDFYADPTASSGERCYGDLKVPKNCTGLDCDYRAIWRYIDDTDEVEFTVYAKTDNDKWTGIGFSEKGLMTGSDAIIAWVDNGQGYVKDYSLNGQTTALVVEDDSQDITDDTVTYENGILKVTFKRKRNTGDSNDLLFDDENCFHILQPVKGGTFNNGITIHQGTPMASASTVCISSCIVSDCNPADAECSATGIFPTSLLVLTLAVLLIDMIIRI